MRLHPAESRIRKLSVKTPDRLIWFDMLIAPDGTRVMICRSRRDARRWKSSRVKPGAPSYSRRARGAAPPEQNTPRSGSVTGGFLHACRNSNEPNFQTGLTRRGNTGL